MMLKSKIMKNKKHKKPISIPLDFDEAMAGILNVKPPKKEDLKSQKDKKKTKHDGEQKY